MKRYIRTTSIECDSQFSALAQIRDAAMSEGLTAKVNKLHHCVDIFDDDGKIIEQRYAEEIGKSAKTSHRYNYVGPGNGDYERIDYKTQRRDYTSEDPYIKYISYTNR